MKIVAAIDSFSPVRDLDSLVVSNSSNSGIRQEKSFDAKYEEILKILEELRSSTREASVMGICSITADESRVPGYFYSGTIYNRLLSDNEIKVLEKGLDFAAMQRKINKPGLRFDFGEFCRRMRIKWHFRNEVKNLHFIINHLGILLKETHT